MTQRTRRYGVVLAFLFALGVTANATTTEDASKPLHHVVLVKFKDDVMSATIQKVLREFELLPVKIPGFSGFQWGTDNSPEGLQKGLTHAFVMTFESAAALKAYLPHPDHKALVKLLRPAVAETFAFDFHVDELPPPAEPGRVHHLVFFKYKDSVSKEDVGKVEDGFAALPRQIPGLLRYQAGTNAGDERGMSKGMTHGHILTFIHQDARDDYLPHPAHRAFGGLVGPTLEDVLVVDFTVRPSDRGLLVTHGIGPHRGFQRDADSRATLRFSGLASGEGPIEARLLSGRRVVSGFDWRGVGNAAGGAFHATLADVPTGGPYTVEVRRRDAVGNVAEVTGVREILVGDVWLLIGQSNMQGVGKLVDVEAPSPFVHNFTMSHRWQLAAEPLHWRIDSRDPVHYRDRLDDLDELGRRQRRAEARRQRSRGAGLGLPFAKHLVEHTGVPVGLISAAHGGTSLKQWDPALKEKGGESLYGSMLKQVRRAGGHVKGALWYQGESDTPDDELAAMYRERFKKFVASLRRDLGEPELPFYYVQIGRFVVDDRLANPWKVLQETQRMVFREIPNSAVVSVLDLPLDDRIHVDTQGLKRVGARLAKIARRELFGERQLEIGPRLAGLRIEDEGRTIRVAYSHVNGRLAPARRINGFSLKNGDGRNLRLVFDASVDPDRPDTVVLCVQGQLPPDAVLWYGDGLDPVCDLVDSEDMAALGFGPIAVK